MRDGGAQYAARVERAESRAPTTVASGRARADTCAAGIE